MLSKLSLASLLALASLLTVEASAVGAGPSVSVPNGKIEFDAGVLDLPPGTQPLLRLGGSFALSVSDQLALQADLMLTTGSSFSASGALHVFTRDPANHLLGGTLGIARMPGATVLAAGPEAELYFGRWSLEAWGGVAHVDNDNPATPDSTGAFVIGDLAFYPDDNWRLSAGFSHLAGLTGIHAGSEYLFADFDWPVSMTLEARAGSDGSFGASIGLKAYIAPDRKSLFHRHREDDPQNRGADLGGAFRVAKTGAPAPNPDTVYTGPICPEYLGIPNPVTDLCDPLF